MSNGESHTKGTHFSLVAIELKNEMKMLTSDKHSSILQMKTKKIGKIHMGTCVVGD